MSDENEIEEEELEEEEEEIEEEEPEPEEEEEESQEEEEEEEVEEEETGQAEQEYDEDTEQAGSGTAVGDEMDDENIDDGSSVASSEIVSEEIIDDSAAGGFSCVGAIVSSIVYFIIGLVAFPVAVYLLWSGENVQQNSVMVTRATAVQTDKMPTDGSVVKFSGVPEADFLTTPDKKKMKALYYSYLKEKKYRRKKTRTKIVKRGKKKIKQTIVEYVDNWETMKSETKNVSDFKIGAVKVACSGGTTWYAEEAMSRKYRVRLKTPRPGPKQEGDLGERRERTNAILEGKTVFVCGTVKNGAVTLEEGKPFVVSVYNEKDTVSRLATAEAAARWGQRILALFLLFFGIWGLFNPFVRASEAAGEYIGFLGVFAQLFYVFAAIAAFVMWVVGIVAVKLLWLTVIIFILLFAGAGYGIVKAVQKAMAAKRKGKGGKASPPPLPA